MAGRAATQGLMHQVGAGCRHVPAAATAAARMPHCGTSKPQIGAPSHSQAKTMRIQYQMKLRKWAAGQCHCVSGLAVQIQFARQSSWGVSCIPAPRSSSHTCNRSRSCRPKAREQEANGSVSLVQTAALARPNAAAAAATACRAAVKQPSLPCTCGSAAAAAAITSSRQHRQRLTRSS